MARLLLALTGVAILLAEPGLPALGQAPEPSFPLTIKNHRFEPVEFEVPANTKVKLLVKNEDVTAEEFESSSLHREKVVPPGKEVSIVIGPLKPGRYEFIGDFNRATAHGAIIVK
jgi:heme/copper-type cytochrome/quinol oxidase subunit 2